MPATTAETPKRWFQKRWVRRTAIGGVTGLFLFTVIGFFVLPPVIRRVAESQIQEQLGRRASIGRIHVNPFALSLAIDDFQIYEADGHTPFVGFRRFYVNTQLSSVYRAAPVVKEVQLAGLHVHVVHIRQTPDGFADLTAYNFSDILAKIQAAAAKTPTPPPAPNAEPPRFSLNNMHLLDGGISFEDVPTHGHHEISHLTIGVPFVSTLPVDIDTFVKPGLAVTIDGTPFSVDGKTKPFKDSLETTLELRLTELDLARYQPYVPVPLKFRLDSGLLTVALDVAFARPKAAAPSVTLKGRVALDKLALRHNDAAGSPLLDLAKFEVRIGKADLATLHFHVDQILLSGLDAHARRSANGKLDWEQLAPSSPPGSKQNTPSKPKPSKPSAASAPQFVVDSVLVEKVNVHMRDETVRPAFSETIRDLTFTAKHLSNAPGAEASLSLALTAVPGGTLHQSGTVTLEPFATSGKVTFEGIEPARFAPYFQDQIAFDIARGHIRVGTEYQVATKGKGKDATTSISLNDAFVELGDFALRRRGTTGRSAPEDFLRLSKFDVHKVSVDVDHQTVQVGDIRSSDAVLRVMRNEAGVIDLTTLVPPPPASTAKVASASTTDKKTAPASPEWMVNVANVDFASWAARFEDRAVKPKTTLSVDGLALHASALSTKPGSRANFDLKLTLNQSGKIQLAGSAVAEPLSANVRLDLRSIAILPFQPYFRDQMNMLITDGALSLKGQLKVDAPPAKPANKAAPKSPAGKAPSDPAPLVAFKGDVDISDFGALDGHKSERLLAWKSFHVGGIDLNSEPLAVAIREVSLTDFLAKLMIFPDAHFNLEEIVQPAASATSSKTPVAAKPGPAKPAPATSAPAVTNAPAPNITVAQVTLQGGSVSFTDRLIQPNYSAELTELGGRITGLSTDAKSTAEVALRGAVDHSGELTIDGKMNPLAKELFVDLKINLREFELPPTSPYAGRYAGYGIDKGKLSLSLDYRIADRKLDAKNKLTLDQFTFGDKVKSPDAVNLPVKLAVALLKDRHGVIDIDLPITGSLDDPQFKLGRLILKTLGNLIVKAVTAPFSLIASAFGGGDEQSYLEFASGDARVDAKGATKLKGVGKALQERPGLSFEIEGLADPQKDKTGLRQEIYDRKLRAQKQRLMVEAGNTAPPTAPIAIDATERPKLIEAVYRSEPFPKPRGPNGAEKPLPPPEMEKLILSSIRVEEDDLRQLALRRANAVKEALARTAPDAVPRLFLVTPRTTTPGNRVELKLKQD